jgi:opacity protein-like surface antigen
MKRFLIGAVAAAALALPAAAVADSCANLSRAPADCGTTCSGPVTQGNWIWLPSIGVPVAAWGFAPPGAADSVQSDFPGANGNYTNGETSSLLGVSVHCNPTGDPSNRQQDHGIQSGCE